MEIFTLPPSPSILTVEIMLSVAPTTDTEPRKEEITLLPALDVNITFPPLIPAPPATVTSPTTPFSEFPETILI